MNILTVVGARPQFIKAAPVSVQLRKAGIREVLVHTGQHHDSNMSDVFFDELEIRAPKHNLGINGGTHGEQTGRMLEQLERVIRKEKPRAVLIYGDTNSTLAGALAASKLHIPVAHVEAGLRSFNRRMPEEINRVMADHLSTLLFCPTRTAVENLTKEGITTGVHKTGDVMYDASLHFGKSAAKKSTILATLDLQPENYILASIHRPENTDHRNRLATILGAFVRLAEEMPVVLPLHPRTKKAIEHHTLSRTTKPLHIIKPVGYLDLLHLERHAKLIMTDSGGIQKEAYFQRVPCVTLRDETEWVETVEAGWNRIANVNTLQDIVAITNSQMQSKRTRHEITEYGKGNASKKIVRTLKKTLGSLFR